MVRAAYGLINGSNGHSGRWPMVPHACPLFGANDNGAIDYRAVTPAWDRLWRAHGVDVPCVAAARAQSALWQGRMAACRRWHGVGQMLGRALMAGHCLRTAANG